MHRVGARVCEIHLWVPWSGLFCPTKTSLVRTGWTHICCILCWLDSNPWASLRFTLIVVKPSFFQQSRGLEFACTIGRYEYFHDYGRQKRKHLELHQVNDFFALFNLTLFFQKWPRPGSKSLTQFVSGNNDLVCLEVSDCRENIEAVHFIMAQCTRYPWPSPTSVNKFSLLYQTLIYI